MEQRPSSTVRLHCATMFCGSWQYYHARSRNRFVHLWGGFLHRLCQLLERVRNGLHRGTQTILSPSPFWIILMRARQPVNGGPLLLFLACSGRDAAHDVHYTMSVPCSHKQEKGTQTYNDGQKRIVISIKFCQGLQRHERDILRSRNTSEYMRREAYSYVL
jgi:hypothetical protein